MGHGTEVLVARRALRRIGIAATLTFAVLAALAGPGNAYVYWTNNGPGTGSTGTTIGRANNDGQGLKPVLINNAAAPGGIIIHGKYIYWANTTTDAIGRASLSGGGVNQHFLSLGEPIDYLAISGPYIYWTSSGNYIGRANLNGSQIQLQCIHAGTTPDGIAAAGGMIYLSGFEEIDRAPAQCGAAPSTFVTLKTPQSSALGLAVADGYLYWAQVNFASPAPGSTIGRVPLSDTSQADESFVPSLYFPATVAVSGGYLYWVDHTGSSGNGAIGREQLASQIRNYSFIKDSNGPFGIAADTSIDPTSTTVTCSPTRVAKNSPTVCTAVVHDASSSELPTGTVLFHGSAGVFFPGGNSCTLTKRPTGGAGCTVGAESAATGKHMVTGAYKGNPTHHASTGSTTFCAGSKTVCNKP